MKLNVDLPEYKWKEILNYLKPHINKSENVANFCNAIEIGNYVQGNSLEQDIYSFLISNNLPPTYLPVSRTIAKGKGGPGLLKRIYHTYGVSLGEAQKQYSNYIANNFKLVPLEDKS
jgi:hypothetical protein